MIQERREAFSPPLGLHVNVRSLGTTTSAGLGEAASHLSLNLLQRSVVFGPPVQLLLLRRLLLQLVSTSDQLAQRSLRETSPINTESSCKRREASKPTRTSLRGLMGILVWMMGRPARPMFFTMFRRLSFMVFCTTNVAKRVVTTEKAFGGEVCRFSTIQVSVIQGWTSGAGFGLRKVPSVLNPLRA